MAVRVVNPDAFAHIQRGADRIVTVSEDEIAEAVRLYFTCCHTIAEGAGAAPLAALMKEREARKGQRVGVILSGGNIDMPKFAAVLAGRDAGGVTASPTVVTPAKAGVQLHASAREDEKLDSGLRRNDGLH